MKNKEKHFSVADKTAILLGKLTAKSITMTQKATNKTVEIIVATPKQTASLTKSAANSFAQAYKTVRPSENDETTTSKPEVKSKKVSDSSLDGAE